LRRVAGLEKVINMWEPLLELVYLRVHQTAGDSQRQAGSQPLKHFKGVKLIDNPVLGTLAHHTTVQYNQVSPVNADCSLITQFLKMAGEPL